MAKLTMLRWPRVAAVDLRIGIRPRPAKTADPHYGTPEHRAWRKAVIDRAFGTCEAVDPDGRRCGRAEARMFADHVIELRDGGAPFDLANGQALCGGCHSRKTAAERAKRDG